MNTASFVTGLDGPYVDAFPITPDNDADLPVVTKGLMIGQAGDLAVITAAGSEVTIPVQAGELRLMVSKVLATGTTADEIVGLV